MSYYGWDGEVDSRASRKLLRAFIALTNAGLNKDLVIQLNDSGMSFDGIADYLDRVSELTPNDLNTNAINQRNIIDKPILSWYLL
jgi:hypothetical protein